MTILLEKRHIQIGEIQIPFSLQKGKPRRIRISFDSQLVLQIETSTGGLERFDIEFLHGKKSWIQKYYALQARFGSRKQNFLSNIEHSVPILGIPTPVEYIPSPQTTFRYRKNTAFQVFAPARFFQTHRKNLLYFSLKKLAEQYLTQRLAFWAAQTQSQYQGVRVKDHKTKWGSCSSLRNINLNWQLILLEEEIIDYVLIHELMHLREMNHGPKFWGWVSKFCPNYKALRHQLKERQWLVGILS